MAKKGPRPGAAGAMIGESGRARGDDRRGRWLVDVRFAPRRGRNAADDEIARLVRGDPDPASLCVITSDAALARRVRELGGDVVGAGTFRRRLDELAD